MRYPARKKEVILSLLSSGEGILLDLQTKIYYSLNPAGVAIWSAIDGKRATEDLSAGAGKQWKEAEVREFLHSLEEESLVQMLVQMMETPLHQEGSDRLPSSELPGFPPDTPSPVPSSSPPSLTKHQPLTKVTVFTAATAGGASFF